jgi:hypothetical protein
MTGSIRNIPLHSHLAAVPYRSPRPVLHNCAPSVTNLTEDDSAWSLVTVVTALLGGGFAAFVCSSSPSPWVAMFVIVAVLALQALLNPRSCIALTLPFLAVQGDIRRIVSIGMAAGSDPIVLVGPCIVVLLTIIALLQNRLTRQTPVSRLVAILLVIMGIQSLNPLQDSLKIGLLGILCYMVPMCWFWVGQSWGTSRFAERLLFYVILPISVAAALFGLMQVFRGRPEYQEVWMRWRAGGRIQMGGDATRPFGFFTSVSEFTKYLSIGIALCASSLIAGRIRPILLALPVLAVALFLASARGPIVIVTGVVIFLFAMRSESRSGWVARTVIGGVCIIGGLVWTLTHVDEMEVDPNLEFVIKHQTEGLLNPLDSEKSTAVGHAGMALGGFAEGFRNPLGRGLGMATHVTGTYGGQVVGAEVDLSNIFVCLGLVGGIAYALLYYRVFATTISCWKRTRSGLILALAAILMVLTMNWLNTGEYSTISLAWFCMGVLDRQSSELVPPPARQRPSF